LYGCSPQIKWVIVGGESGPKHRPMNVDWARSLIEQCTEAGVPVFTKQDSGMYPGRQGRIPDGLWLHEFPAARRSASGTPGAGGQG
jgi:protein gp37